MGYDTQLLLDAPEDGIRKEIRQFASKSGKADVAVVFYAGHGAQLNGSNYLLPIDIDVPHTEADIQFAGLKIDDLINSIGSNTKIVFLDACRDNPALFRNLVKGRGSSPAGLAPASASNFNLTKPGGGIFIAYATDAGAVADDGQGQHSPFTQALLRNMQKSISIDDMFSLVTKEVRLVTKNAQRPFKYASLENIICLTPACSGPPATVVGDIVQQATQSEDEELQIALQTKNTDALETYLQKYPESQKRSEVIEAISTMRTAEFNEWTLYGVSIGGNKSLPQFMQLSSIRLIDNGTKAVVRVKYVPDPSQPTDASKKFPDAAYFEDLSVFRCNPPRMAAAETKYSNTNGEIVYHFKWADPEFLNLAIGGPVPPKTTASTAREIGCQSALRTPLVTKKQLAEMSFSSLGSSGDADQFYKLNGGDQGGAMREVTIITKLHEETELKFLTDMSVKYSTEVDRIELKCLERAFQTLKSEYYEFPWKSCVFSCTNSSEESVWTNYAELTAFGVLQQIACQKSYVAQMQVARRSKSSKLSKARPPKK